MVGTQDSSYKSDTINEIKINKNQASLKVLDLFSGIGGFSLALKGITETLAFCEIDWACQQVLTRHHKAKIVDSISLTNQKPSIKSNPKFLTFAEGGDASNGNHTMNMNHTKDGSKVPLLFKDIHDIDDKMIQKFPSLKKVDMLTAGFPCTDISVANYKGDGIDGNASGLFFEILRLIDLLPNVNFVFLENSPNIKLKGLQSIIQHFKARNFSCCWTYVCASDVGAYHKRKRWFCLCVRESVSARSGGKNNVIKRLRPVPDDNILNFRWREDKSKPRILHKDKLTQNQKREHVHRCRMLGNSIVPQAAAYAWNTLLRHIYSHHFFDRSESLSNQLNYLKVDPRKRNNGQNDDNRHTRTNHATHSHSLKGDTLLRVKAQHVPSPPALIDNYIDIECTDGNKSFSKTRWVTPNYSIWHIFSGIRSRRCNTTLTIQVYYDKNTVIDEKDKKKNEVFNQYICNAVFIEHLMGYPNNWTLFSFKPFKAFKAFKTFKTLKASK